MSKLSEILRERGYVHQHSSETLEEITDGVKRTVYLGIDPSADSLHVGNLVGLLVLRRFLEDGHRIILLTGGGTGMIGDPGGKSEERNLLDEHTIEKNSKAVAQQIRTVFGSSDFIEENNMKWLSEIRLLDFLRDIGKHFSVNVMIKKDIVKDRLESESSISFTEFSYSLLQGYDYMHLNEVYGCDVQVGGSDQWSNILAGVDFIRRKQEKTVYACTWPLLINKSTGKKFGKSEQGAVWLDAEKTRVYDFYQFFVNVDDDAVEELLFKMTLLPRVEIESALDAQRERPGSRVAQRLLARAVTTLVHGEMEAEHAERVSLLLFSTESLSHDDWKLIAAIAPRFSIREGTTFADMLVETHLAASKREAREYLAGNAITMNGEAVVLDRPITAGEFDSGHGYALIKRGKRNVAVISLIEA